MLAMPSVNTHSDRYFDRRKLRHVVTRVRYEHPIFQLIMIVRRSRSGLTIYALSDTIRGDRKRRGSSLTLSISYSKQIKWDGEKVDRRSLCQGAIAAALLSGLPVPGVLAALASPKPFSPLAGVRSRVLYVNDLSGDLDGFFATVHMILSRSVDLRGIVGTGTGKANETARDSIALADEMLRQMELTGRYKLYEGASGKMPLAKTPIRATGVQAIIDEAMRTDSELPLFVAVGGGLTEVASALLLEPKIAARFTLVWIGGDAYPAGGTGETNFNIDPLAAQFIFNDTTVRIWQIPRSAYATTIVSATELQAFVAPHGAIGKWLYDQVANAPERFKRVLNMGETWTLGDNPLVLLTALADWGPSSYRPFRYERTGSSLYDEVTAPRLNPDGTFTPRTEGRKIRIYKTIDSRLMLNDFFAKMRVNFPE